MVRMWLVDPELMCQQHRHGEHFELHKLVSFIRNEHIEKVQFHATRGQVFPKHIELRHEQLEAHDGLDSPISVPYVVEDLQMTEVTGRLLKYNRKELVRRCDDCAKKQEFSL